MQRYAINIFSHTSEQLEIALDSGWRYPYPEPKYS